MFCGSRTFRGPLNFTRRRCGSKTDSIIAKKPRVPTLGSNFQNSRVFEGMWNPPKEPTRVHVAGERCEQSENTEAPPACIACRTRDCQVI